MYRCTIDTPLGTMLAAADEQALTGLWFTGQKHYPEEADWHTKPDHPVFHQLRPWLAAYFAGNNPPVDIPLAPEGTPFRASVWNALRTIPYGTTLSYGKLAAIVAGKHNTPVSARAAGGAAGRNPVSLLIPCHRVIGADGALTGYAGGLERKKKLLELEQALYREPVAKREPSVRC